MPDIQNEEFTWTKVTDRSIATNILLAFKDANKLANEDFISATVYTFPLDEVVQQVTAAARSELQTIAKNAVQSSEELDQIWDRQLSQRENEKVGMGTALHNWQSGARPESRPSLEKIDYFKSAYDSIRQSVQDALLSDITGQFIEINEQPLTGHVAVLGSALERNKGYKLKNGVALRL